jgi:hypothetical protein
VDDTKRFAPTLCAAPVPPGATPRLSDAGGGAHRRKLYFLSSSDNAGYESSSMTPPVGFAIVKEAFEGIAPTDTAPAVAGKGAETYALGPRADWFVMAKVAEPDAAPADLSGTDAGWIYGTMAPDGTVTGAGALASCIGCHDERPGRLFGLRPEP